MTSSFLKNIGFEKPKSEQEKFLEAIAPGGNYTMPPDKPKKPRGVQPSAGWKNSVAAVKEAKLLGTQLSPNGASAYYGPGGNPDGSGRGQAQRRSGNIGLMGPDGKPFDPTPTVTRREEKRGGSKGTQTSPPPVKPADFDAFQKTLEQSYGINFNFGQGRGGMQSNSLPNTPGNVPDTSSGNIVRISNGQNSGNYVKVDNPNFDKIIRGEVVGGFSQAQGAQAGTSSDADVGDQMRALRFDPTKYKEDPERPTDIYETADVGIGRRGAAFLDYDGNSAMALRAAEASQGTIRQNGVTYGKGEDGNWTAISEEGNKALKADGNKIASQDFLKQYMATPAESQSESSGNPAPASRETYQQMADKELAGTVYVPSETNKVEAFAPNASIYSGNPKDFNLEDSDFFQGQPTGEPNKSWLPTEDENKEREELMRGLY